MDKVSHDAVKRVARMCNQGTDASQALGISLRYFARFCRHYDIETLYAWGRCRIHDTRLSV